MFALSPTNTQFLHLLLDHISDCIVAVDSAGYIVFINWPYCSLLSIEPEAALGRHITEVISPETRLHLIAQGAEPSFGIPLMVSGHRLVAKQVPVRFNGQTVGAVGVALFSDAQQALVWARRFTNDLQVTKRASLWKTEYSLRDIVGKCPRIEQVRQLIVKASHTTLPVVVHGETGVGKELVAQAIHAESERAREGMVSINCGSIPPDLVESELFGHEAGAFTGATSKGRAGKFEQANGGTLFLDEISEMPLAQQVTLLRALERGQIGRVGGSQPVDVDVRIIAATNRDLGELVGEGKFREDLYYRLWVLCIDVPALRERNDIHQLADHLLDKIQTRFRRDGVTLSRVARKQLCQHQWPGNIRELRGVLEAAVAMLDEQNVIEELPIRARLSPVRSRNGTAPFGTLAAVRAASEKDAITAALARCGGNKSSAARVLGIDRSHLYKKIEEYDL